METSKEAPEDAITASERTGTTIPTDKPPKRPNAFTELMNRSKQSKPTPPPAPPAPPSASRHIFKDRTGLGAYIASPTSFPASVVISHNENYVLIHDLYPKSSVHLLLLPRNPEISDTHPLTALTTNAAFLEEVKVEAARAVKIVAAELRRRYGQYSAAEKAREEALEAIMASDADIPTEEALEAQLPKGRDWEAEVMVGVHAHPSMSHLHIHILSRDRHSPALKHRKHYNSFATPFFVPIADFPLEDGDPRWHPGREGYLQGDMKCWRCGQNYYGRFKQLKAHLEGEFEGWRGE
ncbi:putative histidine triad nucleotide binding protein [Mytilinidion resinicola]|uniref:Aprataxin-like protein n=1 Tax=Mytilinidion resinicola TaxID=574789 RepID=A0A6A6YCP1_9PEZI|nr:putative histidine triad nucleotide binding protein [Mytilinidion resinicola]KAF2806283.1 putative histidine triad nucleotide binding protein [Mytilinidion resinicola]